MKKSLIEEKWNSITHAIMLGFFSAGTLSHTDSKVIYSVGMLIAMLFSVLYHATENLNLKNWFRRWDMFSIHVAISSTCAAYIVSYGEEKYVYFVFSSGLIGIFYIQYTFEKSYFEKWVPRSYIFFGLLGVIFTVLGVLSIGDLESLWLFAAGLPFYLTGLLFYVKDMKEWNHMIWHVFVMLGSLVHYFGLN